MRFLSFLSNEMSVFFCFNLNVNFFSFWCQFHSYKSHACRVAFIVTAMPPNRRINVVNVDSPVSTKKRMQTDSALVVPNPSVISDEEKLAFERESVTEERERAAIRAKQMEETLKSDSPAEEMFRKGQADA